MAAVLGGDVTAEDFADTPAKPSVTDTKDTQKTDEERLGLTESQLDLLLSLAEKCENEDRQVREQILRLCKGNHDYFRGFQDIFWDEVAHDWTIPSQADLEEVGADSETMGRIINIVRAHGEALISALGSKPPSSKYFPDDAENEADVTTAKAYSRLERIINKHNDASFIFYRALFLLYAEGLIFCHNYNDTDESYGMAKVKSSKPGTISSQTLTCPECGYNNLQQSEPVSSDVSGAENESAGTEPTDTNEEGLVNETKSDSVSNSGTEQETEEPGEDEQEEAEETPEEEQSEESEESPTEPTEPTSSTTDSLQSSGNQQQDVTSTEESCPECTKRGQDVKLEKDGDPFKEEVELESDEEIPKTRQCLTIYGLLNVKFPLYARLFRDGGYLRLAFEEHESLTKEKFPDIFDDIQGVGGLNGAMAYERWSRTDSQYLGQVPPELNTIRVYWFRPWMFNWLGNPADDDDIKLLKDKYKTGCKLTLVNQNTIAEVIAENIDEHWTVAVDPLCNSLHADPVCKPVIPLQDVKNEVYSLSVEIIEHGISETFVDAKVLDFDKYRQQRAQPGMKYPVKPNPGKGVGDSFYQDKPANLSEEIGAFDEKLDEAAQFVLGSFPSIYGGTQSGGSKTLGEYQQSRAQALQRLGIIWNKVTRFFNDVYKKAVPAFARAIKDAGYDEKIVEASGTSFINTWVRHTELTGKIGDVECESSDQLPSNWAQRRDLLMQLLQLQNPVVLDALTSPQNAPVLRDALGMEDIYIPGEDDRDKQYAEFVLLLEGEASLDASGEQAPSVQINPWDDHQVEFATCRAFLVSPTGLAFKDLKPQGYENIVAHMNEHQKFLQQQTANTLPGSPAGQKPESNARSQV